MFYSMKRNIFFAMTVRVSKPNDASHFFDDFFSAKKNRFSQNLFFRFMTILKGEDVISICRVGNFHSMKKFMQNIRDFYFLFCHSQKISFLKHFLTHKQTFIFDLLNYAFKLNFFSLNKITI